MTFNHFLLSFHKAPGLQWLSEEFSLCTPLKNKIDAFGFKNWLQETWVNLAMVDYPYEANFLQPLPRWPIQVQKAANKILYLRFIRCDSGCFLTSSS